MAISVFVGEGCNRPRDILVIAATGTALAHPKWFQVLWRQQSSMMRRKVHALSIGPKFCDRKTSRGGLPSGCGWQAGQWAIARQARIDGKDVTDVAGDDLDPEIRSFAAEMARSYARYPALDQVPLSEARQIAEKVRLPWRQGGPVMHQSEDLHLPTPHGPVRVRIHRPNPSPQLPALIYLHGGGWTIFSIDSHDRLMREYAARAQIAVVGVDYALSPEAKYPVALEQVLAIARLLAREPSRFGLKPERLALGGDSAGGNLALSAALKLKASGESILHTLLLLYGVFTKEISAESARRYGGPDYMLTTAEMDQFWSNYLPANAVSDDPYATPLGAPLGGLPSTFLLAGACDILSEQSLFLAERLKAAGVKTELRIYAGATHSFLEAVSRSRLADQALAESAAFLSTELA